MNAHTLRLRATTPQAQIFDGHLELGANRAPDGGEITVNSQHLMRDGQPWLPVMGEFHYARYPENEWRDELLKVRAGGVEIVATYIFWIHHEEEEGRFDWEGRRGLRRFVTLCGELGLNVAARLGPWCHGEVRGGGLPDWIAQKGVELRSDDPGYLRYVERFYGEIGRQLDGLLWKDGGPVVAVQCENEYGGPAEHLLTLRRMAMEAGLDVPLYTRTGWPELTTAMPVGPFLPLFGGYADGFWDRSLAEMPPGYRGAYLFSSVRADAAIATDQLGERIVGLEADDIYYPYFACEIGGGMERSYHRRIRIAPKDIASSALVKIGSGGNLQGYYMYHGGTNPEGRFSTLQESQATGYWNDLPVKSYDFQAPLGEFGQVRDHYHLLRRMHLFLRDFGSALASMPALMPLTPPASADDTSTLRWSARTNGRSGFLFVNNYQRLQAMPAKTEVQFELCLPGVCLQVPSAPIDVPADSFFFWPFEMDLDGANLVYATAQPVCRLAESGESYFVFAQTPSVPAEFLFHDQDLCAEAASGVVSCEEGRIRISELAAGTDVAIHLWTQEGRRIHIVLLDEAQSLACWRGTLAGRERLFLSEASLVLDGNRLRLEAGDPECLTAAIFPAPDQVSFAGQALPGVSDGIFRRYIAPAVPSKTTQVRRELLQATGHKRRVLIGSQGVAEAPSDADFDDAAVWRLHLPPQTGSSRRRLRIEYVGDVARLYLNGRLLTDNFYNGNEFEVGLTRDTPEICQGELLLKILPLRQDAPIYLPADAWPDRRDGDSVVALVGVEIVEDHAVEWECAAIEVTAVSSLGS
ncbi:hypothetical protein CCAX7_32270 [Capsulimonas corticalis]|uniref:Beta-galactosidase n=1 Tax=Capsulimonas corticalis TaxID=2219043 RepID=A0A402D4A7_9BACT|nr:beta-galactosidase [Capsulimonas corticalis]BDI31176.1 hypothetical protein CCAX7_32270 [Capsulimonas corticalis]